MLRPTIAYLLCGAPRSGSFFVSDLLWNSHVAGRPQEYFSRLFRPFLETKKPELIGKSASHYLQAIIQEGTTPNGVFGAKLHWHNRAEAVTYFQAEDIPFTTVEEFLRAHVDEVRYIHLRRKDKVRQAVSYYRALVTGEWWRFEAQSTRHNWDFNYDEIARLKSLLDVWDGCWRHFFQVNGITPLEILYEEFVEDPLQHLARIHEFVGAPLPPKSSPAKTKFVRQFDNLTNIFVSYFICENNARNGAPPSKSGSDSYG